MIVFSSTCMTFHHSNDDLSLNLDFFQYKGNKI